jgi:hypothetical protein
VTRANLKAIADVYAAASRRNTEADVVKVIFGFCTEPDLS